VLIAWMPPEPIASKFISLVFIAASSFISAIWAFPPIKPIKIIEVLRLNCFM